MDNRVQEILKAIAEGLHHTRFQLLLTAALFLLLIAFLIFANLILKWREKGRILKSVGNRYQMLIRSMDLTINELDLIDRLSLYLRNPQKKYLLLVNKYTLRHCINEIEKEKDVPLNYLDSLRKKITFYENEKFMNPKGNSWPGAAVMMEHRHALMPLPQSRKQEKSGIEIYIKGELDRDKPVKTELISYTRDTACLKNPQKRFKKEDDLHLYIPMGEKKWFRVNAEILRFSRNQDLIYVRMSHLKKELRDYLLSLG